MTMMSVNEIPLDYTFCPVQSCQAPAEIQQRYMLQSTSGPVSMVKVRCLNGHWFNMPEEGLR